MTLTFILVCSAKSIHPHIRINIVLSKWNKVRLFDDAVGNDQNSDLEALHMCMIYILGPMNKLGKCNSPYYS
jgi:hypothetical protein